MQVATFALLLCVSLAAPAWGEDVDERIPVAPGGLLEVDVDLGEGLRPDPGFLEVTSHDADEVRVVVDASGWGASGVRFELEESPRGVRVYGRVRGALTWMFGGPNIQVRIWVPEAYDLDLRTSAGPIRVEDVRGSVRARAATGGVQVNATEGDLRVRAGDDVRIAEVVGDVDAKITDGNVELAWIDGDVDARSSWGGITAEHVTGSLTVQTDRGEIELKEIDGPIRARTERGAIFASFVGLPAGHLETQRGSVRVLIPAGSGAALEAISHRGEVELAPELDFGGSEQESRAVGPLNRGGGDLRLVTARGTVHVGER